MLTQSSQSSKPLGSVALTRGVRVAVQPRYVADQSDPAARQFIFAYRIRVTNESDQPIKLLSRKWTIVDGNGHREDVRGDGIVGQQPRIPVGETFEYSSFCPLKTPWGTMEGSYIATLETPSQGGKAEKFEIAIARFYLARPV